MGLVQLKGFGLPELLISLFLSSFIILSLVNYYLHVKEEYLYTSKLLNRDFDTLEVVELIRNSIRHAGFTPCGRIDHLITPNANKSFFLLSSSLTINRMDERYSHVLSMVNSTELLTDSIPGIKSSQKILVADCFHAEVKQIQYVYKSPNGQRLILTTPLAYSYLHPITVGRWLEEKFYMKKSAGILTLMYKFQHADELTSEFNSIAFNLQKNQKTEFIHMTLGLGNDKTIQVQTRLRE